MQIEQYQATVHVCHGIPRRQPDRPIEAGQCVCVLALGALGSTFVAVRRCAPGVHSQRTTDQLGRQPAVAALVGDYPRHVQRIEMFGISLDDGLIDQIGVGILAGLMQCQSLVKFDTQFVGASVDAVLFACRFLECRCHRLSLMAS